MAEERKKDVAKPEPAKTPGQVQEDRDFRRKAALAVLTAYVTRQGTLGNSREERNVFCRFIWDYADAFIAAENLGPLPEKQPDDDVPAAPRRRPAHPSDEFAVHDGDTKKRGFATYDEAEWYASGRPGAKVVQVSGPEQLVADPNVT